LFNFNSAIYPFNASVAALLASATLVDANLPGALAIPGFCAVAGLPAIDGAAYYYGLNPPLTGAATLVPPRM
jgi:hypothetical protein